MACQFSINLPGNPPDLVTRAQAAIVQMGGSFSGDSSSGNFSISSPAGNLGGSYTITGNQMDVTITNKPIFIGCGMIEKYLTDYLSKGQY